MIQTVQTRPLEAPDFKQPSLRQPIVLHLVEKQRRGISRPLEIPVVAASVIRLSNDHAA